MLVSILRLFFLLIYIFTLGFIVFPIIPSFFRFGLVIISYQFSVIAPVNPYRLAFHNGILDDLFNVTELDKLIGTVYFLYVFKGFAF